MNQYELMHYGVPGMKWGKRKTQTSSNYTARVVRGHAGPGKYLTSKRQLAGDKRDLETLNKGGHLSVGLTKKRQEAYDKRDRAAIEKRIKKTEAKLENKPNKIARMAQKTRLNNLKKASDKATSKTKKYIDELSKNYNVTYDVTAGQYILKSK